MAPPNPKVQARGEEVFKARCASCHEPAIERAPTRPTMRLMTVADLNQIMTSGATGYVVVGTLA